MTANLQFFRKTLLLWNANANSRSMPWKGEKDPYRIWLSEIILQQTRVEQGRPYYERFIRTYPDVRSLAAAKDEEVFRNWQGLGYYARCRNMLAAAREIVSVYKGEFPGTYPEILRLKGIGSYTAAAIASFAFRLPYAVVDGNVFRVLSRFFGISIPVDTTAGKKYFAQLAGELLDKRQPGIYNQALMDFGAVICRPQQPLCPQCPLSEKCIARKENKVEVFPLKSKRPQIKKRYFNYIVIRYGGGWYIRERKEKDIWRHLHEFVLIEKGKIVSGADLQRSAAFRKIFREAEYSITEVSPVFKQQLTHQTIFAQFTFITVRKPLSPGDGYLLIPKKEIKRYAFPKLIVALLQEKTLSLAMR